MIECYFYGILFTNDIKCYFCDECAVLQCDAVNNLKINVCRKHLETYCYTVCVKCKINNTHVRSWTNSYHALCDTCQSNKIIMYQTTYDNLVPYFEDFKKTHPYWSKMILYDDDQFKKLIKHLSENYDEKQWCLALNGLSESIDKPPIMLSMNQAAQLSNIVFNNEEDGTNMYHAFMPCMLDNRCANEPLMQGTDRLHYYRQAYRDKKHLFYKWNQMRLSRVYEVVDLGECSICLEILEKCSKKFIAMCTTCGNKNHFTCLDKLIKNTDYKCIICKKQLVLHDTLIIIESHKYFMYLQESEKKYLGYASGN